MFVKRDFWGGWGDFFCKCKINEHALDTKKKKEGNNAICSNMDATKDFHTK